MKKFTAIVLFFTFAVSVFAWDFLTQDGKWIRNANPFAIKSYVYRQQDPLPAEAKFDDNNKLIVYTTYETLQYICEDGSIDPPADSPQRISILRLIIAIRQAGIYDEFMAWLDASGYKDLLYIAQELTTDNEYFIRGLESVSDALELSDEEIKQILSSAILPSSQ